MKTASLKPRISHWTLAIALLALGGCAGLDDQAASDRLFDDPDTKRLQIQEEMSRVTRELSITY